MKFRTCAYPKDYTVEMTPRKVAATKRRLARAKDAVALLPDLAAELPTVEQDIANTKKGGVASAKWWRDHWAQNWRDARRSMERLPEQTRRGLLRYWNHWVDSGAPGSPEYFATFVAQAHKGVSFWAKLRELRRFQLVGQGKLPFQRIHITDPWRHRHYNDHNLSRFRQKRARKLGLLKVEHQQYLMAQTTAGAS